MKNDAKSRSAAARSPRADSPAFLVPVLLLALLLAGTVAFLNSLHTSFVFDDEGAIVSAENIRRLWPITEWLSRSNPRPVVTISLAINYAIGELNPFGYHVVNLAIHLCAALVLFDLIRRTITELNRKNSGLVRAAPWLAFTIALLWTVHPLQTQGVTYLVQRGESLTGLFLLLALYCVILAQRSKWQSLWYALSIACCILGMGTKASMIAAPPVVFFYDWLLLTRSLGETLRRRWWLYAAMVAVSVGVLWFTGLHTSLLSKDPGFEVTVGFGLKDITPLQYLSSQPGVLLHYLRLAFWPHPLCIDYEWPVPDLKNLTEIMLPAIPIVALLLGTLWACWKKPWLGFVGLWFFVILAPSSSIVPVKDPAVEHRMYLPLAAVITVVVIGGYALLGRLLGQGWSAQSTRRAIGGLLVLVAAVALTGRTYYRNQDYAGPLQMWQSVLAVCPNNARGWINYGESLTRYGRNEDAAVAFRRAFAIQPDLFDAYYNLGNAMQVMNRLEEAEQAYLACLKISPGFLPGHIMLGNVYDAQQRYAQAEVEFRAAIAAANIATDRMTLAKAHYNLGNALVHLVHLDEGIAEYRKAIEVAPYYEKAHYALGWALEAKDQFEEAQGHYTEAVRLNPNNFEARKALDELQQHMQSRQKILQQLDQARVNERTPMIMMPSHRP